MKAKAQKEEPKQKINWIDVEELASGLCNIESGESSEIADAIYEKYDVDFEQYQKIVEDLFDMLDFGVSPLTETAFVGFSNNENGHGVWLLKKEVNQNFINGVIGWLTGNEKMGNGFSRVITKMDGTPEFEITIKPIKKQYGQG